MGQIKVSKKNHMVTVKVKNHANEQLNVPLAQWLSANNVNGLISGTVEMKSNDKFTIIYSVSDGQTLQEYMKSILDHQAFTNLCDSLVNILSSLSSYNLNYANVLLDLSTIIVRPSTGHVEFLYYPATNYSNHKYFNVLLSEILNHLKSPQNENLNYIVELRELIQGSTQLSWKVMKDYVNHLKSHAQQYDRANGMQGQNSAKLYSSGLQGQNQHMNMQTQYSSISVQSVPSQLIQGQPVSGNSMQLPLGKEQGMSNAGGARCSKCGLVNKEDSVFCENCGNVLTRGSEYNSSLSSQEDISDDDCCETTVLGAETQEDDATTVLSSVAVRVFPYLIRNRTQEKVVLDKDFFLIGKSRTCDYMITGNSAISRKHATFLYENGNYYIVDSDSTNGTSLNGSRIQPEVKNPVTNHMIIRLADEDFQFCLDQ